MNNASRLGHQRTIQLFILLALVVVGKSTPLRGTRLSTQAKAQPQRRQLMEKDSEETESPTEFPTIAPTEVPFNEPALVTSMPSSPWPLSSSPVSLSAAPTVVVPATFTPTNEVQTAAPTTSALPSGARQLYPFSLRIQGILNDEITFRSDLESYLLKSMKQAIPALQNIVLTTSTLPFGQRLRGLQQATLLAYQGTAILDTSKGELSTTEDVQRVQRTALETSTSGGVQDYLSESSSQPVNVLQLQVSDFEPIAFSSPVVSEANIANTGNNQDEEDNTIGIIIGVVAALVVISIVGAFFVWRDGRKPPPPPPYEFDQHEQDIQLDGIPHYNNDIKVSITDSTTYSEGLQSPAAINHSSEEGMEVIALPMASQQSRNRGVIDLSKPAKHSKGIESVVEEAGAPQHVSKETRIDGDLDSTFDNIIDLQSIVSDPDESMAGYSLATDVPEQQAHVTKPSTPPQLVDSTTKNRTASPAQHNNAQIRWFAKPKKRNQPSVSSCSSASPISSTSSSPNRITLDAVSDPLRNSLTGEKTDTDVFMDDDDEEVEVVSRASSSYKEDDSLRGSSSVMSGISDNENVEAVPQNTGALGFFYREQDEQFEDFDVLPQHATDKIKPAPDDFSDVPSDERHSNIKEEQDLTGFAMSKAFQQELNGLTAILGNDPNSNFGASDGTWEESPEMLEAWVRERRRIKRQSRNRREERKQPPLTMEI